MRIKLEFDLVEETIKLPINYNRHLQELIFSLVSEKLEGFQPDQGESFQKKHFSFFNFSKIFGDFEMVKEINNQKSIVFNSSINFFVSAPYDELMRELVQRMVPRSIVRLYRGELCLSPVKIIPPPVFDGGVTLIRALSPIAVTDPKSEGNHLSRKEYLSPIHPQFSEQIRQNVLNKYQSCFGYACKEKELSIVPHYFSEKKNTHFVKFKDYSIKGYSGIYKLSGSEQLKTFAFDCGLGEGNAQGFGMFDIYKERKAQR